MQIIRIDRPGGHDRLRVMEAPDPVPAADEVLIDVAAVGVNFADCIARMGLYKSAREKVGWPLIPGFEVAGTVAAVGESVQGFRRGDRVMALTLFNGYSTRLAVPAEQVQAVPAHWSLSEAAGFPTVFLTAWYALHVLGRIRPDHRLLVHSAAGGVGQALVQLGLQAGADVVGVVGAEHKREALSPYGIPVIDKSSQDLWAEARAHSPEGYDLISDANGYRTLKQSYAHLAAGGRLIVYGFHSMFSFDRHGRGRLNWPALIMAWLRTPRFDPLAMTSDNRSVLAFNLSFMGHRKGVLRDGFDQLLSGVNAGTLKPLPVTTYPFESVAQAHHDLESRQTTGKLVLTTSEQSQ
ncbi:NADPH:quinone reductase-like Zn-dependent oxidoreductase [Natronospira proteinivora]|uniref:NADPH:quinone reductase-like Zn-dependent oxidoreductase n=1 Tax=Natronospira proteinivora TaxID=1807133 RepID=A0ABT1GA29_9GAMM|nr:medium chain dehydrogenase/reductase family protein [Natronospira proteinivora]MCP1727765.1 NADPH:quinone reductase-like Zn-dependent oxidoreductase [Natronospira proteinivora]